MDEPRRPDPDALLIEAKKAGRGRLKREAVFGEIYVHTSTNLKMPQLDVTHRWVREGDWKLIVHLTDKKQIELFNLANDSHERTNLAEKEGDYRSAMTHVQEAREIGERVKVQRYRWMAEHKRAILLLGVGRFGEAVQLFERLLDGRSQLLRFFGDPRIRAEQRQQPERRNGVAACG